MTTSRLPHPGRGSADDPACIMKERPRCRQPPPADDWHAAAERQRRESCYHAKLGKNGSERMARAIRPKPKELYDEDFYVWTEAQARLLRQRRFDALDLENLIEEVEGLGRAEKSRVLNNASVIVEHLLKLQHSPAREPRNAWRASIREHRRRLRRDLTPRLRKILEAELPTLYAEIRDDTAALLRDHGEHAAADALPATCPYTQGQITGDWWP
jgi:hypothetical protein